MDLPPTGGLRIGVSMKLTILFLALLTAGCEEKPKPK